MLSCRAPISFINTATLKLRRKRAPHQTKSVHWICNLNTVVRLEDRFWVNVVAPWETPILSSVLSRPCPRYSLAERILLSRPCPREVPSLQKTEIIKLAMREREMEERGDAEFMRNDDGDVIKYRYDLVTSHTARRSGITNLYLTDLFDIVQMMSISGHKDQRTFFDYIKLSSDEIADKIMEKLRQSENVGNEGLF